VVHVDHAEESRWYPAPASIATPTCTSPTPPTSPLGARPSPHRASPPPRPSSTRAFNLLIATRNLAPSVCASRS
jgi:hypothetical protein